MSIENADPLETKLDDDMIYSEPQEGEELEGDSSKNDDVKVLQYLGEAKRKARNFQQIAVAAQWEESEAAYRSRHHDRSRYNKPTNKNKSSYFKPKTRVAVQKILVVAQSALFSSADVLTTTANDDSNELQRANSAMQKEILNYHASNKTRKHGLPLMRTTLAARQQASVMGMCVSKQSWKYSTVTRTEMQTTQRPEMDADGQPIIDFMTGQPLIEEVTEPVEVIDVVEDKPCVDLIPLEMVLINQGADWADPIQSSPDLIVQHPTFADEIIERMENPNPNDATQWRDIDDAELKQGVFTDDELQGLKVAREGAGASESSKGDNKSTTLDGQSSVAGQVLDVWECFYRVGNVDYHCWTLRDKLMLSEPTPVEDIYPAFSGSRPYVLGSDLVDPFVLYPESDVYSWQQSQNEINEMTNLRMDSTRKSIFPVTKVKAGKNIDLKAAQRQDAQHLIMVRDHDDVTYDRPPGPGPSVHQEINHLNLDFDDQSGAFSNSSVQTNRSLNETVGGMAMLSQNAHAQSELKLSLFVDTWFENVVSQLVSLIQYYEDDETLLAVCGKRAKLFEKFGISEITDELLEAQVNVSINVGQGSSDPAQRLMRYNTAMKIAQPILALGQQRGELEIDFEGNLDEIFSLAGYSSGADRFIKVKDKKDKDIPAEQVKKAMGEIQGKMKELQAENDALKKGSQEKMMLEQMKLQAKQQEAQQQRAFQANQQNQGFSENRNEQASDQSHDVNMAMLDHKLQAPVIPPRIPMPMRPMIRQF
tara:strand:+ start:18124 stop:20409 length:2286 start_codon:yes stop_codon:yes gene_type:complete